MGVPPYQSSGGGERGKTAVTVAVLRNPLKSATPTELRARGLLFTTMAGELHMHDGSAQASARVPTSKVKLSCCQPP